MLDKIEMYQPCGFIDPDTKIALIGSVVKVGDDEVEFVVLEPQPLNGEIYRLPKAYLVPKEEAEARLRR